MASDIVSLARDLLRHWLIFFKVAMNVIWDITGRDILGKKSQGGLTLASD